MTPMERDKGYLEDVQTAIIKIQRYTRSLTLETFLDNNNDVIQDAVLRNISIIGEAVSKMSNSLTSQYPEIPWRNISGMRNRLVHDYNGVNLKQVWNTITQVIPSFLTTIQAILVEAEENDGNGDGSGGGASGGAANKPKRGSTPGMG